MAGAIPSSLKSIPLAILLACSAQVGAQQSLPGVTIAGKAEPAEQPASFPEFGGLSIGELPVSIGVLRARELRTQGVESLSQAIRRDPAASDAYNTVGFVESIQLRGFLLDGLLNYRRNGLPVSAFTPITLVNKQQIDVQKGLNGVVTGSSSPGGTVNFITKRAGVDVTELSLDGGERGSWLAAADFGRRIGEADGRGFGYRLNVAHGQRRPAARDADGERSVVAAAVDWQGPAGIRAEAEFEVQNSRQVSVPGLGLLDVDGDGVAETLPSAKLLGDPRVNLNNQPWSQPFDNRSRVGTGKLAMPLGEQWTLTLSGLLQRTKTNDRLAFPDGCSNGPNYLYPGLCGNYEVDIYDYRSSNERRATRVLDLALDGKVQLGGMTHRLRVAPRTTRYSERFEEAQAYNYVGFVNALAPTPLPEDPSLTSPNTQRDLRIDDMQLSDSIDLTQRWRLFAGTRLVRVEAASIRTDGTRGLRFTQSAATPWLAAGYSYAPNNMVFASLNRGFEVEAVPNRPTLFTNAGQLLPASRSTQGEIGWRGNLGPSTYASVALFEIRRPLSDDRVVTPDANGASLERVADGREARHRGIELDVRWALSPQWTVGVQGAWIDAVLDRSLDPQLAGRRATNVPKSTAALQVDWRPAGLPGVPGLAIGNRLFHSGERAITRDNSVTLPAWWQWDAWLTAPLTVAGRPAQLRASVENLTDRRFWREAPTTYWGGTYLFPAQPRTFRLGLSVWL